MKHRAAIIAPSAPRRGGRARPVRALLYVGKYRGAVDERGFEIVRRLRSEPSITPRLSLADKALLREQFYLLLIDQEAASARLCRLTPLNSVLSQVPYAVNEKF